MFRISLATVAALALASSASAAPIVIDDFSQPTFGPNVYIANFSTTFTGLGAANTIGETRQLDLAYGGNGTVTLDIGFTTPGALSMGTLGNTPNTLTLTYGSAADLNANFFGNPGISLSFAILDAAAIGTMITLQLEDGDGRVRSAAIPVGAAGDQTVLVPFSAFTTAISGPAGPLNLTDIDGIVLTVAVPANGDLSLTNISSNPVPEPATLATLGLMGVCGGYFARRKLKAGSVAQA